MLSVTVCYTLSRSRSMSSLLMVLSCFGGIDVLRPVAECVLTSYRY